MTKGTLQNATKNFKGTELKAEYKNAELKAKWNKIKINCSRYCPIFFLKQSGGAFYGQHYSEEASTTFQLISLPFIASSLHSIINNSTWFWFCRVWWIFLRSGFLKYLKLQLHCTETRSSICCMLFCQLRLVQKAKVWLRTKARSAASGSTSARSARENGCRETVGPTWDRSASSATSTSSRKSRWASNSYSHLLQLRSTKKQKQTKIALDR